MKKPLHQRSFGPFILDAESGELWRNGLAVRLQPKPTQLLLLLTESPGRLHTREEIARHLWGDETYVDYERSLNFAISQIRQALGDDAAKPSYLQTLSRRGYRFVGAVREVNLEMPVASENIQATHIENGQLHGNGAIHSAAPEVTPSSAVAAILYSRTERPRVLKSNRSIFAAVAMIVVLAGVAAVWWYFPASAAHTARVTQITTSSNIDFLVKPVSDGARVFYIERAGGHWNPMETSIEGGESRQVPGLDPNTRVMDISPDRATYLLGRFSSRSSQSSLWLMPVQGGTPVRLGNVISGEAVWAPDGAHIVYANGNQLRSVNANGSDDRVLAALPGTANWLAWSPDGQRLRLTIEDDAGNDAIWEMRTDGSQLHRMISPDRAPGEGQCCGEWTPDGRYFIFTAIQNRVSNLWALREPGFSVQRIPRNPVPIIDWPGGSWGAHVAPDGNSVLFYAGRNRTQIVRLDMKTGEFVPLTGEGFSQPAYSRDGRSLAYVDINNGTLWKANADGTNRIRLSLPDFTVSFPRWSPDGRTIAMPARVGGSKPAVYLLSSTGSGPERLLPGQTSVYDADWSPDGKTLVVVHSIPEHPDQRALFLVDIATKTEKMVPASTGRFFPHWSADGRYLAAYTDREAAVDVFDFSKAQWQTVVRGTIGFPTWSRDSHHLYYQKILEEGEPIYSFNPETNATERQADCKQELSAGISRCAFMGLAPDDSPLFDISRGASDLYRAELSLR